MRSDPQKCVRDTGGLIPPRTDDRRRQPDGQGEWMMKTSPRRVPRLIAAVLIVGLSAMGGTASAASCASPEHAGGDWPTYGHDLSNSFTQPLETTITPLSAALLSPRWTFSVASEGVGGGFQSVPVIYGGCAYVGTNLGTIIALNADTGEKVWATTIENDIGLPLSSGIFAVAVDDTQVYANVSVQGTPQSVALDRATGDINWQTTVVEEEGAYTNASAILSDGMLVVGLSGPEDVDADTRHPGGMALLDTQTGDLIYRFYTIDEDDDAAGEKGASMWGTPVIDEDGYLYDGTGQPANKADESRYSNAILKVDIDRGRDTFGTVVDAYKGNPDYSAPEFARAISCIARPENPVFPGGCLSADVDFGASPNLFEDDRGRPLVGALQKSGTYHAVYADNMQKAWEATLSLPIALGNSGPTAVNDGQVFAAVTPGLLYAIEVSTGYVNWVAPIGDVADYHPVTVAGGVVYVAGTHGLLMGFDEATGIPVLARPMPADVADVCVNLSAGVVVARNKVYAHCDTGVTGGGWLIAYGL